MDSEAQERKKMTNEEAIRRLKVIYEEILCIGEGWES